MRVNHSWMYIYEIKKGKILTKLISERSGSLYKSDLFSLVFFFTPPHVRCRILIYPTRVCVCVSDTANAGQNDFLF